IRKNKRYWVVAITLLILFGAALRLYKLGSPTLDTDEISSVLLSKRDIGKIVYRSWHPGSKDDLAKVEEPPLPYVLIHASLKAHDSDAMARLPSAILGVAGILAIFILAKQWFNETTALWSSFLLTFSLYHIFYSQFARGYAGFMLFTMLSFYFLLRYTHSPNRFTFMGLILSNAGGVYFHYAMLHVFIIESVFFFVFPLCFVNPHRRIKPLMKSFLLLCGALFALSLPVLPSIASTVRGRLGGDTLAFEFNFTYFKNVLCRYGAGNGIAFYVYIFFALAGIFMGLKNAGKRKSILALLFWLCAPFLLIAVTGYKYDFHIRYFIYVFPAYILLLANGISSLGRVVARQLSNDNKGKVFFSLITILLFLSFSIIPLRLYYRMPAKMTDWKAIARYIARNYSPDKRVYIESSFCVHELGYYLGKTSPGIKLYTVDGDKEKFKQICEDEKNDIWYVDNSPVFDSLVFRYFNKRIVFGSPVFYELGKRELIDWDKSWFSQANIRRYFPCIYLNSAEKGKGRL
ncbi:MAG: glycosyltransferase family 39 protein, partial [Candidatus Omnitrophota bacterium]